LVWLLCLSCDKTALIGAPFNENEGVQSGSAYIFTWDGSVWTEQQKLNAQMALNMNTSVVRFLFSGHRCYGSADFENGEYAGAVYVLFKMMMDGIIKQTPRFGWNAV